MIEFNTDFLLALIEPALRAVRFDYFNFFEDCAGKGGPLYGPAQFNKFFRKPYRRIIARLRRAGIRSIWVDSDGDSEVLVPLWMEAGVNCFWPLEQASAWTRSACARSSARTWRYAAGIDKMEIAKGRKAIEKELYAKLRRCWKAAVTFRTSTTPSRPKSPCATSNTTWPSSASSSAAGETAEDRRLQALIADGDGRPRPFPAWQPYVSVHANRSAQQ